MYYFFFSRWKLNEKELHLSTAANSRLQAKNTPHRVHQQSTEVHHTHIHSRRNGSGSDNRLDPWVSEVSIGCRESDCCPSCNKKWSRISPALLGIGISACPVTDLRSC